MIFHTFQVSCLHIYFTSLSYLTDATEDADDRLLSQRLNPELLLHFSLTNLSYWYRNKDIMGNDLLRYRGVEQRFVGVGLSLWRCGRI